jgi:hypothetical protein
LPTWSTTLIPSRTPSRFVMSMAYPSEAKIKQGLGRFGVAANRVGEMHDKGPDELTRRAKVRHASVRRSSREVLLADPTPLDVNLIPLARQSDPNSPTMV